jgi:beta-galactosidase
MIKPANFIIGAQYYRAPTPESSCWAEDLAHMREIGMNSVKFWVQWRWSHRLNDCFYFDDVDHLMDLALDNQLQVHINVIFDVAPHWLYDQYPDAKQVWNNGHVVEPYVVGHRQIGGHPGPCYNHPGALVERQKFLRAVVNHYRDHPALAMWDVWNEPELCFPQRSANIDTLACYCTHCQNAFRAWVRAKYVDLEHLNEVWGRCYETWEQVETPRSANTFGDFLDWREFHIQSMTREAAWRLDLVHQLDPTHQAYLHVVPNMLNVFNPVSCAVDDFEMATLCDVFAATMNGGPLTAPAVVSAARGKVCYNVESHLNFGATSMHQRILGLDDLLRDWLPQISQGIRGFLFWQYRPEVLGLEAPAWGLVNLNGSDRPITTAVKTFIEKITPHSRALMAIAALPAEVGIWKSRRNEIFHFAMHGNFETLIESTSGYINALVSLNLPYHFISERMLELGDLRGVKLLIMPTPYALSQAEAQGLDAFIRQGGVAITEAHLAGYNIDTGRHSRVLPGCGLAERWGLRERASTSTYHLNTSTKAEAQAMLENKALPEDVRKSLADFVVSGGPYLPIQMAEGTLVWGAHRYAQLEIQNSQILGWFERDAPCLAAKEIGAGAVFYAGTNLGQGAQKDATGMNAWLRQAASRAGVRPQAGLKESGNGKVQVHLLTSQESRPHYLFIHNFTDQEQVIEIDPLPDGEGIFSGVQLKLSDGKPVCIPGAFIDLIALDL